MEANLCHSFQAFHSSYNDTGLMGIYFVADKNYVEDMMHWSQNAWSAASLAPTGQLGQRSSFTPCLLVLPPKG